jgi:phosphohistidine phosphatase
MRDIILLRHAKAMASAPDGTDRARPLSSRGEREARAAAEWLAAHGAAPGRVLCSPAQRTMSTCEHVRQALDGPPVRFEPDIYEATPGQLIGLLEASADVDQVLLVGHNPGLEHLVALLVEGRSQDYRGMPPAAIAWLEFDGPLEPGNGRLKAFWSP